jgi:hypothetical protein
MHDFESPQKMSAPMWALAALCALAFHLGCAALALEYLRDDDPEDELGAPAIEIGVELLAKHVEPTDLPPGPDVEASVASPRIVEQREIVEPTDLPRAVPTETEDPERVVSPVETDKPEGTTRPFPRFRPLRQSSRWQWTQRHRRVRKQSASQINQ